MDSELWTKVSDLSPLKAAGILGLLYAVYYVLYAAYAITLSPLAKIPGPITRKFSYMPCVIMNMRGRESHAVRDLHRKYGPVVRVNPEMVSFTGPTAWKEIYGYPGAKKFKKFGYRQLRPGVPDLLTANGADHSRQRAALNRAFSEKALREQEHHFQEHIDLFLSRLEEKCDEKTPLNITQWIEFLAFDIIGTLAFSSSFHCLEDRGYHPWVLLLLNFFKSTHYVLAARMCGIFFPLVLALGPIRDLRKGEEHLRRSYAKVQERIKMPEDDRRNDFWTYISRQNEQKEGSMSVEEMEVNAALLIPAGSDTIATAVAGCLYLLLKHPDTLARLRKELEAEFRSESDITMPRLAGLPYIRAVVDEALRMYPPISGELRRAVPPEGAVVCGHFIPGDTIISVYALASCDNASNFAQPKRFTPERWLTTDERPDWTRNDHLEASQPFSVGPRNCIGMGLAYAETKLILARLLFRFDLELLDDEFNIDNQKVYVMWQKPPLSVRLSRRKV
ncbi:cytochrome P450 [Corynascus similis CBS 632.67]